MGPDVSQRFVALLSPFERSLESLDEYWKSTSVYFQVLKLFRTKSQVSDSKIEPSPAKRELKTATATWCVRDVSGLKARASARVQKQIRAVS